MAADLSRYLEHLPAFFQEDPFLGRFLLAFERILSGLPAADPPNLPSVPIGLEQLLDRIHTYFDPLDRDGSGKSAPPDFLPWLATWVATSLREDWSDDTRRRFIANIVPLYRQRGTKAALQSLLKLYTGVDVEVLEDPKEPGAAPFPPRYFQVRFTVTERDPSLLSRKAVIATDIIDREKPAHTFYGLRISYPSLEIASPPDYDAGGRPINGVFVGVNTVLGGAVFKS
jgi:phage tail-like protein